MSTIILVMYSGISRNNLLLNFFLVVLYPSAKRRGLKLLPSTRDRNFNAYGDFHDNMLEKLSTDRRVSTWKNNDLYGIVGYLWVLHKPNILKTEASLLDLKFKALTRNQQDLFSGKHKTVPKNIKLVEETEKRIETVYEDIVDCNKRIEESLNKKASQKIITEIRKEKVVLEQKLLNETEQAKKAQTALAKSLVVKRHVSCRKRV